MIEEEENEVMTRSERECPRCGVAMYVVERGGETLDICRGCGGIWFDPSELDDLVGKGSAVELLISISDGLKGEGLLCPDCDLRMVTKEVYGVYVDHCPECRGVWMDAGETEKVWELDERTKHPFDMQVEEIDAGHFWDRFKAKYKQFEGK
jgi:Zn-finger nucleic acid-binding protein